MALAGIIVGSLAGFLGFMAAWLIVGLGFGVAVAVFYAAAATAIAIFVLVTRLRRKVRAKTAKRDSHATA